MSESGEPRRSEAEQQRIVSAMTDLFERRICFNEFLGFRIDRLDPDEVRIRFDMRPELVGHYLYGRLHGGVISSVLDVGGGLAVMWATAMRFESESTPQVLKRFAPLSTVDLRIDYLRQGIGEHFIASAEVVRLGRRIASTRMLLCNDQGEQLATGNGTYIVS